MKKIVTDIPNGNYETLMNFCIAVDGRTKFRETTEGENTDVYDFCRKECISRCKVNIPERDDGELLEMMCLDCLYCVDCRNALLYLAAVQAAELRERLRRYESGDVATVVNCKDCAYCEEAHYEYDGEPHCIKTCCSLLNRTIQPNDYCSYGKRKETETT